MVKKLKRLFYLILGFILYRICSFIPKKNNRWIFGSWFGRSYSDNTKFFFEYINHKHKNIEAIWLTKDKSTIKKVRSLGYNIYHMHSIKGLWYSARANYVFTTSFIQNVLNPLAITKKTKIINLWHGTPLKVLGKDHNRNTETGNMKKNKLENISLKNKIWPTIFPFIERPDDYFMVPSREALKTLSSAFPGNGITKHFISPYPRNDIFSKNEPIENGSIKKIIYMPTWRSHLGSSIDLFSDYGFDTKKMNSFFEKHDFILDLKNSLTSSNRINLIETSDIYDIITDYDLLITDYSSIYFDYLYTNKPIIFTPFDLNDYLANDHKFYYSYDSVTPGPKCNNWTEVMENIDMFISTPEAFLDERKECCHRFNPVKDGSFSELLYEKIMGFNIEK